MNLLTDDPADIAERLSDRIRHRGTSYVYAKPSGQVTSHPVNDRRNNAMPALWLIGAYRNPVDVAALLQDLLARRAELEP
ncbi:hypothetical protein [Pseudoxanthomonas sp. USHLN014]|uniref:hypothetical protein n=1 Tax=Pseudoxanthomonas sp. USHLN014 TaxID=3081297 RepID=UPI00301DAAA8